MGVIGGNFLGLPSNSLDRLPGRASGSGMLTFLAGAEIDPDGPPAALASSPCRSGSSRSPSRSRHAFAFASFVAGWQLPAAQIAGLALSTTSVAVVYAVMIESGLAAP